MSPADDNVYHAGVIGISNDMLTLKLMEHVWRAAPSELQWTLYHQTDFDTSDSVETSWRQHTCIY